MIGGDALLVRIRGLSAGFDERVVLDGIDLDLPRRGTVVLMGPGGVGKTTLLRTLGRWNDDLGSAWARGEARLGETDLLCRLGAGEVQKRLPLLSQKARLYTASVIENAISELRPAEPIDRQRKLELAHHALEAFGLWAHFEAVLDAPVLSLPLGRQRQLSIARLMSAGGECLLADEPLRDLRPLEAEELETLLRRVGCERSLLLVTHNQAEARRLADQVCLVTAGRTIEQTPAAEFFCQPRSDLGRQFLRMGNCWPKTLGEPRAESIEKTAPASGEPAGGWHWPAGFHWVIPKRLGGMQAPGLYSDAANDFRALEALGVRHLINLTETPPDLSMAATSALRLEHFPIPDMGTPDLDKARDLCRRIVAWIDREIPVVLHCRAGLGRTGTLLACVLVERGADAVSAIHRVRCINPRYIQSEAQFDFIGRYEVSVRMSSERSGVA